MPLRLVLIAVLLLAVAACDADAEADRATSIRLEPGRSETATATVVASPAGVEAADVLDVTCTTEGAVLEGPDVVAAEAAGVVVQFSSPRFDGEGAGWVYSWSGPVRGRGGGLDPSGTTTLQVPLAPGSDGDGKVGCSPPPSLVPDVDVGAPRWTVRPEVTDPEGRWRDPRLDCASTVGTSAYGEPVRHDEVVPPAQAILSGYVDDLSRDELHILGYPEAPEPVVGVVRDGRTLATVAFSEHGEGHVVANGVAACVQPVSPEGPPVRPGRPADAPSDVEVLPDAPLAARTDATGTWTGREVVLWGGATSVADDPSRCVRCPTAPPSTLSPNAGGCCPQARSGPARGLRRCGTATRWCSPAAGTPTPTASCSTAPRTTLRPTSGEPSPRCRYPESSCAGVTCSPSSARTAPTVPQCGCSPTVLIDGPRHPRRRCRRGPVTTRASRARSSSSSPHPTARADHQLRWALR